MTTAKPAKYNAPALDKGLDIIELLSNEGISLSQAEIAQGINRTPNEIYRMLVCLEERGYLIRSSTAGKYRLSLKMYSLSHRHTPFDELKRVARDPMQQLSETTKESCHLSILNNNQLLVISQTRSPNPVSLSIEEGTHFPLSMTTSGRILLKTFSEEDRKLILSKDLYFKKWSKKEQTSFLHSISNSKPDAYRISNSSLTGGVTDIALPIGANNTNLKAVLAVSIFTSSVENGNKIDAILQALTLAQNDINRLIGS